MLARVDSSLVIGAIAVASACVMPNPAYHPDGRAGVDASDLPSRPSAMDTSIELPRPDAADAPLDLPATEVATPMDARPDLGPPRAARRVTLADALGVGPYGGQSTGAGWSENCANNGVLIGYASLYTTNPNEGIHKVGRLEARCAELWISAGPPFTVELRAESTLGGRGDDTYMRHTAVCGPGQIVVGFFGRAGGSLNQVGFQCGTLELVGSPATLRVAAMTPIGPFGGTGGQEFGETCATGAVARGQHGNFGAWIDALGLHCGTPMVPP